MIADQPDVNRLPPTPDEGFFGGHILYYFGNPLPFLLRNMQQYGAISHFRLFKYHFFQVNDPELVGQVLVKQASKFHKSVIYKKVLSEYLGNGLLISDGDYWKRQRKLAQPAFHTQRIQAYADIMVDNTLALRDQWQAGQVIDVAHDMMQLTLFIVAKTLFDTDVHQEVDRVGAAMDVMLHSVIERPAVLFVCRSGCQPRSVSVNDNRSIPSIPSSWTSSINGGKVATITAICSRCS